MTKGRGQEGLDPWMGERMVSFRASEEFKEVLTLAARSEHRTVSGLVRRAVLGYLVDGGFFEGTGLDGSDEIVKDMVQRAQEELDARK